MAIDVHFYFGVSLSVSKGKILAKTLSNIHTVGKQVCCELFINRIALEII